MLKAGLLADDVVLQMAAPQILTTESVLMVSGVESAAAGSGAGAGAGVGARVAAASAALENGRRLLLAARAGDTPQVRALLAAGAPFTADWLGTSPLHLAAANNHLETVEVLLRAGVSRDARTKVERTPLHLAACAGHAAVVSALLTHGANVDCRDMLGMTPLHWAAERGHTAAARALLAAGADPALPSKFRRTARTLAARDPAMRALFDEELAARERRQDQPDPPDQHVRQYKAQKHQKENMAEQITNIVLETEEVKPQKTPDNKPIKYKLVQNEKFFKTDTTASAGAAADSGGSAVGSGGSAAGGGGGGSPAALLLRRHGITLLPPDPTGTVLSALQCGRTVVLSDAGKLMLKESESPPTPRGRPAAAAAAQDAPSPARVLRKVDPVQFQKVKLVQMAEGGGGGAGVTMASPLKPVRLKLRPRGGAGGRQVRLVLDRASLQRLVTGGSDATATAHPEVKPSSEEDSSSSEVARLRAQLAAARATIAQLRRQLAARTAQ